ncbi:MAG TPA: hypothetical protein VFW76_06870 [Ktedonobacterales bacterium]|nr:hypothetical protein [Ktedonobacterales bacterium]
MQRVPQHIRRYYPVVRLYLDDAEELLKLVREHCKQMTIEAEGFIVPSLDDLTGLARRQIRRLDVKGHTDGSYLHLELNQRNAYCYLSRDDDTPLRGVFTQIDAILKRRARLVQLLLSWPVVTTASALFTLINCVGTGFSIARLAQLVQELQAPGHLHFTGFGFGDLWSLPLFVAYLTYAAWLSVVGLRYHTVIYLYPWHERTTFWERHKEEIMVQVIAGVIIFIVTAIVAFVAGYVVGVNR